MNEQRIIDLENKVKALEAASTIPYNVEQALRQRLGMGSITVLTVSGKSTNSEDQTVDEGGAGNYSVLSDPAGWLQVTIASTVYYIPYYPA